MDETRRNLERAAARDRGDREAALRLAAAQVRSGELIALTQLDLAPPRRTTKAKCNRQRSLPRVYLTREPEGGDLTPRARRAALAKILERLGSPSVRPRWTQTAGCTCACSPGFVLRGKWAEENGDIYARVLVAAHERLAPRGAAPNEPWRPVPTPPPVRVTPTNPMQWNADRTLPPTRLNLPPRPAPVLPPSGSERRTPPVGTLLQKRDRRGQLRCEAVVVAEGIRFRGTVYSSLSAAALAAARALGLTTRSINGWAWWGLENPRRSRRTAAAAQGA